MTLQVSYDAGATWHRAAVVTSGGQRVLALRHPADAHYVSLRAYLVDTDGNTTSQTLINAYALRPRR